MAVTEIKIKKVTLKDENAIIEYEQIVQDENGPVINNFTLKGGNKPHNDLLDALAALRFHAIKLCEQFEGSNAEDMMHHIKVSGVSVGGSDENEGATIVAQRTLQNGKVLNLIVPFQKWEDDYVHRDDFCSDVQIVLAECQEYLDGKYAPNVQMEMNFGGEDLEKAS